MRLKSSLLCALVFCVGNLVISPAIAQSRAATSHPSFALAVFPPTTAEILQALDLNPALVQEVNVIGPPEMIQTFSSLGPIVPEKGNRFLFLNTLNDDLGPERAEGDSID